MSIEDKKERLKKKLEENALIRNLFHRDYPQRFAMSTEKVILIEAAYYLGWEAHKENGNLCGHCGQKH